MSGLWPLGGAVAGSGWVKILHPTHDDEAVMSGAPGDIVVRFTRRSCASCKPMSQKRDMGHPDVGHPPRTTLVLETISIIILAFR